MNDINSVSGTIQFERSLPIEPSIQNRMLSASFGGVIANIPGQPLKNIVAALAIQTDERGICSAFLSAKKKGFYSGACDVVPPDAIKRALMITSYSSGTELIKAQGLGEFSSGVFTAVGLSSVDTMLMLRAETRSDALALKVKLDAMTGGARSTLYRRAATAQFLRDVISNVAVFPVASSLHSILFPETSESQGGVSIP